MLLFSHIVILAERWSLAINNAEQTNIDLRRLLDVNISITSEMQLETCGLAIRRDVAKLRHPSHLGEQLRHPVVDMLEAVEPGSFELAVLAQ